MTKLSTEEKKEGTFFLRSRSLQIDGECSDPELEGLNETVLREEGSYKISFDSNVTVLSPGEVTLNYNDTFDDEVCNNLIDMANITESQTIIVNGFKSTEPSDVTVQIVEIPIALLIGVAAFSIYGPSALVIVPVLFAPAPLRTSSSSEVVIATEIRFEGGEQTIILNNVNASDLRDENFIFASNTTSDSDEGSGDPFPLELVLGLGLGVGIPLLLGLGYCACKGFGGGAGIPENTL